MLGPLQIKKRESFKQWLLPAFSSWLSDAQKSPFVCAVFYDRQIFNKPEARLFLSCSESLPKKESNIIRKSISLEEMLDKLYNESTSKYYSHFTGENPLVRIISCNYWYDFYYSTNPSKNLTSIYPNCQIRTGIRVDNPLIQLSIIAFSIVWGRGSHVPIGDVLVSSENKSINIKYFRNEPWLLDNFNKVDKPKDVFDSTHALFDEQRLTDPNNVYRSIKDVIERKC